MNLIDLKRKIESLSGALVTDLKLAQDGFRNIIVTFRMKDTRYVARLSFADHRTKEMIEQELDWMDFLSMSGVRLAKPVQMKGSNRVISLALDDIGYWLTFFEHTDGRHVNVEDKIEWNGDLFHRWGEMLARLHCTGAPELERTVWLDNYHHEFNCPDEGWVRPRYDELRNRMNTWEREPKQFGLIHNDLHQGNFHVTEGEIVLFDFDDCAYHFFANDLAVSIYHALWTGTSYHPEWEEFPVYFLTHFVEGYGIHRPQTGELYEKLIVCLKMRELFLYCLFRDKWDPNDLADWQAAKLVELKDNAMHDRIPYERELRCVKYFFEGDRVQK